MECISGAAFRIRNGPLIIRLPDATASKIHPGTARLFPDSPRAPSPFLTTSISPHEPSRMIQEPPNQGIRRDVERYRGDRFRVEHAPSWVARRKVMNIERRPGEPVSILLFDRQIHAPSNCRYTRVVRRLETHQAVQDLGNVEFGFDPATQQLLVHGVSIFRAGNLANHAAESSFELFQREAGLESDILNGAVTALLVLKDLRVGDVLDLEFSIVSDSALLGDHYWFTEIIGSTFPIGRQWLSWVEREGQPLHVEAPAGLGSYQREDSGAGPVRTWSFEHTPVLMLENDIPVTCRPFPEVSFTTFGNWKEVAGVFLDPWSSEPANRDELDIELDILRRQFADDAVKGIAAAIDLVRHHVRYLGYSPGVFALVPADPAEVWRRRFGDCKEKSRLLCWLLNELGIEADPVLVHTGAGAAIRDLLPSPGVFNHVVVRVRHAGTELWVDPTDVSRRGDVAGWKYLPFHHGLPLVAGSDQLIPIPSEPRGTSGLEVEELVVLDSRTRGGKVIVTHTYRMGDADQLRHVMDSRGRTAIAHYLADLVKQTRPDAAAAGELEVTDDPHANRLTLHCEYLCQELLKPSQDGSRDLFFLIPHAVPPRVTGLSANRKHPLAIQHPVDVIHTIRVNPEDPRKIAIPKHTVNNEFFRFSFNTTTTPQETVHVFVFQSLAGTVPASKLRAYSSDLAKVADALNWHIAVQPRQRKHSRMRPSSSPDLW